MEATIKNILVCSRPGVGKTQFAIEYYIDKISKGIQGVFICLEMKDTVLMDRILKTAKQNNIALPADKMRNLLTDNLDSQTIDSVISYIQDKQKDEKINFVIIDYLQLLQKSKKGMKKLFEFTNKHKIEVIATSQLKRHQEDAFFTKIHLNIAEEWIVKYFDDIIIISKGQIYSMNDIDSKINEIINLST